MPDLSNIARQAASRPDLVASELSNYQLEDGLDDAGLAAQLGCSVDVLTRLRLCTLPRSDHFWDDVSRVAEYVCKSHNFIGGNCICKIAHHQNNCQNSTRIISKFTCRDPIYRVRR